MQVWKVAAGPGGTRTGQSVAQAACWSRALAPLAIHRTSSAHWGMKPDYRSQMSFATVTVSANPVRGGGVGNRKWAVFAWIEPLLWPSFCY